MEKAEKIGIDTKIKVKHPFEERYIPVYIANFILMDYGTGAIFGCPAHDQRDFDFAKKYSLEIKQVVSKRIEGPIEELDEAFVDDGYLINSDFLNGLRVKDAKNKIINKLMDLNIGKKTVKFKLRDWGVSRQRYWGCPIPIIYLEDGTLVQLPEESLPVELPEDIDLSKPGNPLENHPTWKFTTCPYSGKPAIRETDTFDTFLNHHGILLVLHPLTLKACLIKKNLIILCLLINILAGLSMQFCTYSIPGFSFIV